MSGFCLWSRSSPIKHLLGLKTPAPTQLNLHEMQSRVTVRWHIGGRQPFNSCSQGWRQLNQMITATGVDGRGYGAHCKKSNVILWPATDHNYDKTNKISIVCGWVQASSSRGTFAKSVQLPRHHIPDFYAPRGILGPRLCPRGSLVVVVVRMALASLFFGLLHHQA